MCAFRDKSHDVYDFFISHLCWFLLFFFSIGCTGTLYPDPPLLTPFGVDGSWLWNPEKKRRRHTHIITSNSQHIIVPFNRWNLDYYLYFCHCFVILFFVGIFTLSIGSMSVISLNDCYVINNDRSYNRKDT